MPYALIEGSRVAQIENETFDIAPPLQWVECDGSVTTDHTYDGQDFVAPAAQVRRIISFDEFQDRLTAAAAAPNAIWTAIKGSANMLEGIVAAAGRGTVNLDDGQTIAFADALLSAGAIDADGKTAILADG